MQAVKERKEISYYYFLLFLSQIRQILQEARQHRNRSRLVDMETRQSRKSQVKTDIGGSTSFPGLEIISLASMRTGVGFEEMGVSFQQCSNNKIRIVITRTSKEDARLYNCRAR